MKKLLILSLVALWVSVANAQYFTHTFTGTGFMNNGADRAFGFNTSLTGQGYFITGGIADGFGNRHVVTRTNTNGTPTFNNKYIMTYSSVEFGTKLNVEAFELPNGTGYGIIGQGAPSSPVSTGLGFFYYNLNTSGTPTGPAKYYYSSSTIITYVGGVCVSNSGSDIYIIGSDGNKMSIVKAQISTGNIVWSSTYTSTAGNLFPEDVMVNPYNTSDIVVCGTLDRTTSTDGYIMTIDGSTGSATSSVLTFGSSTVANDEGFRSIKKMNNTIGGSNGFILSGFANGDMLVMAINSGLSTVLASKSIDYSTTGTNNEAYDIIERLNTSSQYEYYVAGYEGNLGTGSTKDAMVVKLNSALNVVINGEFTSTTNDQLAYKVDQYTGTTTDGLSIFSTEDPSSPATYKLNITRIYFNGTASCNQTINNTTANPYSITKGTTGLSTAGSFTADDITVSGSSISDNQVCFNATLPGGSNAKVYNPKENELLLSPNPARVNETIDIKLLDNETVGMTPVTVSIFDMEGRQYYEKAQTVQPGNSNLSIDLTDANLKDGLYFVTVSGQTIQKHVMLRVVK